MLFPGQQRNFFVNAVLFFERLASFGSLILKKIKIKRWLRAPLCHRLTASVEAQVVNSLSLQTQMVPPSNTCQGSTEKWIFGFICPRDKKKKKRMKKNKMGRTYRSSWTQTGSESQHPQLKLKKNFRPTRQEFPCQPFNFYICQLGEKN